MKVITVGAAPSHLFVPPLPVARLGCVMRPLDREAVGEVAYTYMALRNVEPAVAETAKGLLEALLGLFEANHEEADWLLWFTSGQLATHTDEARMLLERLRMAAVEMERPDAGQGTSGQ